MFLLGLNIVYQYYKFIPKVCEKAFWYYKIILGGGSMIIGVDVGYTYTKTATKDGEDIFRSTAKEGSLDINKSITIEFEGREFTIGEKGSYSVDLNKTQDETFLLCLYTAIVKAMHYNSDEINLVTGLPVAFYSSQKQFLKDSLEGKDIFIKLNGRHKIFTINRCLVFPQSAGLFTLYPELFEKDVLVIDIGGMTVDVSYFEGLKLVKYATYPMGMLKLYGEIIQVINSEYAVNLDILDAERIIQEGIEIDGKMISIEQIIRKHAEDILRPIKLEFPFKTTQKHFIGGGAAVLKEYLPGPVREGSIFDNARAFYRIGVEKFGNC
jgi:plasmid segregation protein ParM